MHDPFATLRGASLPPAPDDGDTASVLAYVEYAIENNAKTFLPGHAQCISRATGRPIKTIMDELRGYGLRVETNASRASVRGFGANDHNKYSGNPGSGGGGGDSLIGMAGREG
jgi:hypothetical protein